MRDPASMADWGRAAALSAALALGAAAALHAMGRPLICTCGVVELWHGTVNDAGNSQHLSDWYSLTHILHGVLFYAILWLASHYGWVRWAIPARLVCAVALEGLWEVAENTNAVIERYRSVTIDQGYFGDSIVNSLSDISMMVVGFLLASRLSVRASALLFVTLEVVAFAAIRDTLTLNILMLVYPLDSIRQWQAGA